MIAAAATTTTSPGQLILSLVLLGIFIGLYFLPTIVALLRHVPNVVQVALLNFFLGWSFIGWIVALVWAAKPLPQPAR